MKTLIGIILMISLVGCASTRIKAVPVAGGAGVGVQVGADKGFLGNNWGKIVAGIITVGGLYMVADHNDWLVGGEKEKITEPAPVSNPGMGDNNIIVNGSVGGDVRINYGNTEQ